MRTEKQIELISKHYKDQISVFSGEPHLMVWTEKGTGFVSVKEMSQNKFDEFLKVALKREEKANNEVKLKQICADFGVLEILQSTAQWRDSIESLLTLFSFALLPTRLVELEKVLERAALSFDHQ
ncbi:TPA: hypothetical protein ACN38J_003655 [Vibrio parahaemolyticus]